LLSTRNSLKQTCFRQRRDQISQFTANLVRSLEIKWSTFVLVILVSLFI